MSCMPALIAALTASIPKPLVTATIVTGWVALEAIVARISPMRSATN